MSLLVDLHLLDGQVVRFEQRDTAKAAEVLGYIRPARLFAQPVFMLGSASLLTAFPTSAVVRVDVQWDTPPATLPEWAFPESVSDIEALTEQEVRQRIAG